MSDRAKPTFLTVMLIVLVSAGCQGDSSDVEKAYQAIVQDYTDGRLDRVYDQIEPETRGMLDAVNRGLDVNGELKSLEGRRLFQSMWGTKRTGMYPMWLFVPGEVTNVEISDGLAALTISVDAGSVNPAFHLTTRKAYMVRHDGAWKVSAGSIVKSRLRKAGMTQ